MTPSEKLLWSRLRGNRLMGLHFRRQHVIREYIVDFYCHQARLVVEIDGNIHEFQKEYDRMRDAVLISGEFSVLHLPATLVAKNIEETLRRIKAKCCEKTGGRPENA